MQEPKIFIEVASKTFELSHYVTQLLFEARVKKFS